MFEKSLRIFVTDTKRMRIFTNREEILRKPLQVFIKMNCEKTTQMEKPKACGLSKAGLVYYFPVQAEFVRGYCGQICISSPAVVKMFQFTAGSFPEFIDQYYGRVIFALIRLRLACVTPK